jgi:hypothetical protein
MTFVLVTSKNSASEEVFYLQGIARRKGTHLEGNIGRGPHFFRRLIKGTVPRDFDFRLFSCFSFPQDPEYIMRAVLNFFENLRRYSQLKMHHRCCRQRWQMEKFFHQKSFHYLFWTHLGNRVNMYCRYIFSFKFSLVTAV